MTDRLTQSFNVRALTLIAICVVSGQFALQMSSPAIPILVFLVLGAAVCFLLLPTSALVPLYFFYLLFEGAIKILSNYHPVLHIGSDLVFIAVFWRLYQRKKTQPNIAALSSLQIADLRTAVVFFCLYWTWVVVQFANPVALGFLPSIAGLKLHLIPFLFFFIVCFYLSADEIKIIPPFLLGLAAFEGLFSIFDWYQGVGFLAKISPRYYSTYMTFLPGYPYRPFGTTALPGAPGVWISVGIIALFLVVYSFKKNKGDKLEAAEKPNPWWFRLQAGVWLYIPIAILTLIVCQVRTTLIKALLMICFAIAIQGRRQLTLVCLGILAVVFWNQVSSPGNNVNSVSKRASASDRFDSAISRILTLRSAETYKNARGGNWAMNELGRRSEVTMTGIGLSRMSASAGPWYALIAKDSRFGPSWSFSDNLALAVFTELGAFGFIAYFSLHAAMFFLLLRRQNLSARLIAIFLVITLASGYASEGMYYQPEASLFWTFLGIGIRSESAA